jgi:hypothetical protein
MKQQRGQKIAGALARGPAQRISPGVYRTAQGALTQLKGKVPATQNQAQQAANSLQRQPMPNGMAQGIARQLDNQPRPAAPMPQMNQQPMPQPQAVQSNPYDNYAQKLQGANMGQQQMQTQMQAMNAARAASTGATPYNTFQQMPQNIGQQMQRLDGRMPMQNAPMPFDAQQAMNSLGQQPRMAPNAAAQNSLLLKRNY